MKIRTFDNLKFKKFKWIEIGLTLVFGISCLSILLSDWNTTDNKADVYQVLAVLLGGICIGIGIQTFTETFYIKKQKESI